MIHFIQAHKWIPPYTYTCINACENVGIPEQLKMIRKCSAINHQCVCDELNLESVALTEGSTFENWLRPPIDTYLKMYAFNLKNPNAVMRGRKPILEEVGPFVYKIVTLKDTDNNIRFWEDGTLSYRQRKLYFPVPELSQQDPDKTFITVPNIPYWTVMNKVMKKSGVGKQIVLSLVEEHGLNQPFINVSLSGLLWGYHDDLPCLKLDTPKECMNLNVETFDINDPFDSWGIDEYDDPFAGDGFGYEYDAFSNEYDQSIEESGTDMNGEFQPPKDSVWEALVKPKEEFVGCDCEWGFMRDLNVTMRKPIRLHLGVNDLDKKGLVTEYDRKNTFGWWQSGSTCDQVKGQDSNTLPPNLNRDNDLEIFHDFMCRTLKLKYERDVNHGDIKTYRFSSPVNAFGRLVKLRK